ncbi:MAG: MBL fold metallo-hydrolase [Planctomycetota bacterium]
MARLTVTMIDVGWGDCILLEFEKDGQDPRYALIDCNDRPNQRLALSFVKRHLQTKQVDWRNRRHFFDFVLLTHGHDDHSRGLKQMMSEFETKWFWYPKSGHPGLAGLLRYANRSAKVDAHQSVDETKLLPDFGDVSMKILWPPHSPTGPHDPNDENNNSVVMALTLADVSFVLTGDCKASNWPSIVSKLPVNLKVIQVPHHAAKNGMFDSSGGTPWLDAIASNVEIGMSCHISPHKHPHPDVITELNSQARSYFRTDEHYHVSFSTDGATVKKKWSRV